MSASRKLLFSAMKNEAPFIVEWVAYHRAIGFDEIHICSNDSDDGTTELLNALADMGVITHVLNAIRPGMAPQGVAAASFRERGLPGEGDWAIWLDADEFLNIHVGDGRVDDLVSNLGDANGMFVAWRMFGDGGNSNDIPEQIISEKYVRAAAREAEANASIKTFFRMGGDVKGFGRKSLHRPILSAGDAERLSQFRTSGGGIPNISYPVHRAWAEGEDRSRSGFVPIGEVLWDIAQINHYSVRSRAMLSLKKLRGRGFTRYRPNRENDRHNSEFYDRMNRNEEEDRSILRQLESLEVERAKLMQNKAVRDAHLEGMRRTEKALADAPALELATPAVPLGITNSATQTVVDAALIEPEPEQKGGFELTLPEAEAACLRSVLGPGKVVLEYGSGGSTFEALHRGADMVFSVESSEAWAARIDAELADAFSRDRFRLIYSDIGRTKAWGKPANGRAFGRYHLYPNAVWDMAEFRQPDVILVDGRFRAACFATAAMRLTQPATLLFDDYAERPYYHWVEEICPIAEMAGRMAVFMLEPDMVDKTLMTQVAGSFADSR